MKTKPYLASILSLLTVCSLTLNAMAAENEVTIKGEKKVVVERKHKAVKNEVFHLAPDAKIRVGENNNATLADLKVGTVVHLAYTEENGVRIAYRISDALNNTGKNGALTVEKVRKGEKHLHAVLESVDAAANTFSVRAPRK